MNEPAQLDFLGALSAPVPPPAPREVAPVPKDGLDYLRGLVDSKELYIFMMGANAHMRFVRSFSSTDPGRDWYGEQGCSVMYAPAQKVLREAGYYKHCRHISAKELGNTRKKLTSDVWRK